MKRVMIVLAVLVLATAIAIPVLLSNGEQVRAAGGTPSVSPSVTPVGNITLPTTAGWFNSMEKKAEVSAGVPEVKNRLDAINYYGAFTISPSTAPGPWLTGPAQLLVSVSNYIPQPGVEAYVVWRDLFRNEGTCDIKLDTTLTMMSGAGRTSSWETGPDQGELDDQSAILVWRDNDRDLVPDAEEQVYYNGLVSQMDQVLLDGTLPPGAEVPYAFYLRLDGDKSIIGDEMLFTIHADMLAVAPVISGSAP